ncbi:uncharacterized protein ELE39_002849 [Cryptosporidium sp. chipmunk genotype I]|uniref:uncharacterized protein n=1 Tax=Cryptosporidium sp. chipmunk genotype I TaxID=1280935 RepID=UPI00351A115F|nr:hypothetical protein ELE39_002849 [Cryptosporidium sp. chipmunk genotype I]
MIYESISGRSKVISLFIQCMLLVKVTSVKDANNFLKVLNENSKANFENIFELVNACNDELCSLLLEVVFTKEENGNEFIGIRSNINSNIDIESLNKEKFGFLNLGLKRIKDYHEIKDIFELITEKDCPISFEEICSRKSFESCTIEEIKKTISFLEDERWIIKTKEGIIEGPRAYIELLINKQPDANN